jgi:peptidyl-prolyl cis-trans isomerase B (cyclophilin B)
VPTSKQRREAERRRLHRQMQRRQRQAVARRRMLAIVSVICVVAVIGIVVGFLLATSGNGNPTATPPTPTVKTCAFTKSGTAARHVHLPPTHVPTTGTVKAEVDTSQGAMTFTLDRHEAPCTVANFVSLAQQKYFNSTPCHRLTTGTGVYILQCGDPTGTGRGGPGYRFPDEVTGQEKYTRGVLAMANAGPNTNGSQFFIVYKNTLEQPNYTIFGSVTSGLSVVDKVAKKGVQGGGSDGKPALPITIKNVTLKS